MTATADWDVEKHKVEHECDEHWELRRNFLETHKEKFPEEQLVCLAQVFTNVELLGCRYPKETMDLIAELSEDVAKDYRERQKSKLQRTFVKASDAASSKVKGLKRTPSDQAPAVCDEPKSSMNFVPSEDNKPCKIRKIDNAPYGNIILMQHLGDPPITIIESSAAHSKVKIEYKIEKKDNRHYCEIFLNSIKLAEGDGIFSKTAKGAALDAGLVELQKHYYTVKVKRIVRHIDCDEEPLMKKQLMGDGNEPPEPITSDNVGSKMMKIMGWLGGGLGKAQQGIVEPITVQRQLNRKGFGVRLNTHNKSLFERKARETLKNFVLDKTKTELVFSCEFASEERAVIHRIARVMDLKAASTGPKDERTLVVSRKIRRADLVKDLLACGGSNDRYELIEPTGS